MINVMVRRKMEHRMDNDRIRAACGRLRDGEAYPLCAKMQRNAKESTGMWYVIQTQTGKEQELTECIEHVLSAPVPCLFCDRAGMHLANGRGTDDLPETAFSILCNRGHGYAGSILSGIKTDSETLQAFADRLRILVHTGSGKRTALPDDGTNSSRCG